ncbi:heat shock protein 26 [Monosporozyma unispora]|nr:chaperone protein hsp26 [Kazachstania unispora]
MSFNSPFFNFFDAINDEVDNFNNFLDTRGYQPRRARLTDRSDAANNQITKRRPQQSALTFPEDRFFSDLDDWFNDDYALAPTTFNRGPVGVPVDILDHDKNYELKITVPGVKSKKDIDLEYHKEANQIVVSGEVPSTVTEENKDKVKVNESSAGTFKRVISLPDYPGVDADNIKADYASGVLTLTVPKLKPKDKKKDSIQKIEISSQEFWGN